MRKLLVALLFLTATAHAEDADSLGVSTHPQQIRWGVGYTTQEVLQTSPYNSQGIIFSVAMPITPKYWIEGIGISETMDNGNNSHVQILFKRLWDLNKHFELAAAIGPSWVHTRDDDYNGNFLGGDIRGTVTYWINEHWGVSAVPAYGAVLHPTSVENDLSLSILIVYGRSSGAD